jgi:hypothetical protein
MYVATGICIVHDSDLPRAITTLSTPRYTIDRVVVVHLNHTSKKNSKGGMIMDVAYCIIFTNAKTKREVTVNTAEAVGTTQLWNLKWVGKAEHKVYYYYFMWLFLKKDQAAKGHKMYRQFSWVLYAQLLRVFYTGGDRVLEYGTEYCGLLIACVKVVILVLFCVIVG